MKDLHNARLRSRLPCFIEGFLSNRNGLCLSDLHEQEMGVPKEVYEELRTRVYYDA